MPSILGIDACPKALRKQIFAAAMLYMHGWLWHSMVDSARSKIPQTTSKSIIDCAPATDSYPYRSCPSCRTPAKHVSVFPTA